MGRACRTHVRDEKCLKGRGHLGNVGHRWMNIVTWQRKVRVGDSEKTSIARQWHSKHVSTVTNNHATEELLVVVFSIGSVPRLYKENQLSFQSRMWGSFRHGSAVGVASQRTGAAAHGNRGHCWNPLPGKDWWRHSRVGRPSMCCSEKSSAWIGKSTTVTCSYVL
jgi:hypothetical protein